MALNSLAKIELPSSQHATTHKVLIIIKDVLQEALTLLMALGIGVVHEQLRSTILIHGHVNHFT
jgi:hypothetical protein